MWNQNIDIVFFLKLLNCDEEAEEQHSSCGDKALQIWVKARLSPWLAVNLNAIFWAQHTVWES